jgi:hypothetical protein
VFFIPSWIDLLKQYREFCLRHPEIRDVCDLGQMIFWNKKWAFYFTAVMFLLNNTFIMGLHCLVGAKWWNTITGHGMCTIGFAAITALISFAASIPRTFNGLAKIATFSALFTFISVILAAAFSGAEGKPAGYPKLGERLHEHQLHFHRTNHPSQFHSGNEGAQGFP